MNLSKLLRMMTLRGWGWTIWVGALLGAGYGIVLFATALLSLWTFKTENAPPLGAVFAFVFAVLTAALFGAFVAGVIGFIAGPIGGAVCALLTHFFFAPPRNEPMYHQVTRIAGGVYGILAIVIAVRLISTSGLAPQIETFREILMLYIIPGVLGGLAGVYISSRVIAPEAPLPNTADVIKSA